MTRQFSAAFLLVLTVLSLRGQPTEEPSRPLRIVSLAPALTELVCHLGYGKYLVGRSEVCNYPAFVKKLPVTGGFGKPQVERILSLQPALILANDLAHPAVIHSFRQAKIDVLLRQCRDLDDYCAWVTLLGKKLNCMDQAEKELQRIRSFRKRCNELNRKILRKKKVLWVIWDSPLMVAGKGSLPHTVLTLSGGINSAAEVDQEYFKASREWVLTHGPDVIIWTASPQRVRNLKNHPFWKQLPAVRQGKVIHTLDQDILQRPGPRLPLAVETLRKALERI